VRGRDSSRQRQATARRGGALV